MKTAIIKASKLGLDCWSAKRFTDGCDECPRVMKCKLPEARIGRVKLLKKRLEKAQDKYASAIHALAREKTLQDTGKK